MATVTGLFLCTSRLEKASQTASWRFCKVAGRSGEDMVVLDGRVNLIGSPSRPNNLLWYYEMC